MRQVTDRWNFKVCLRALPCRLRVKAVTQQDCLAVSKNRGGKAGACVSQVAVSPSCVVVRTLSPIH